MAALYDVISGPAGRPRDWARFRSLFHTGAYLASAGVSAQTGRPEIRVRSPDEYIARNAPYFATHGFVEREIDSRSQALGPMVHVFSAYASRHDASDAAPFERGINSIELVSDGDRWWIMSVLWSDETKSQPLPGWVLQRDK